MKCALAVFSLLFDLLFWSALVDLTRALPAHFKSHLFCRKDVTMTKIPLQTSSVCAVAITLVLL